LQVLRFTGGERLIFFLTELAAPPVVRLMMVGLFVFLLFGVFSPARRQQGRPPPFKYSNSKRKNGSV